jgi:hypothetical protein
MALGSRWTSHWRSCHESAHLRLEIKTPYPCYREFIPQRKTTKERHHASVHNRRSNSRNRSSCRSRTCFRRTDQRGPAQAEWPVLAWSWGRERSRLGILATLRTAGQRLSNSTDNSPSHLGRLSGAELWCLSAPPLLRGLFHAGSRPPAATENSGAILHRRVDALWKQRARLCATGGTFAIVRRMFGHDERLRLGRSNT